MPSNAPTGAPLGRRMKETEHVLIKRTLDACGGKRREAAKQLGISERTLRHKLQRMREQEGITL